MLGGKSKTSVCSTSLVLEFIFDSGTQFITFDITDLIQQINKQFLITRTLE